ncbi:ABC transporter permease [Bacillus sp. T3]|uniref:ABC transporter permease n=1 Tax=Bacillus sp. T3 TaxID=467262 RepID=UPI0029822DFF|nr:ABC transporter permease [Bacillus sp. T3]
MRRIWSIQWLHMTQFLKTPAAWILMVIMPALFSLIFGGMALNTENNKPIVNIVDSKGELHSEIVSLLKRNDQYLWKSVSETQAKKNIQEQEAIAAIVIPENVTERIKATDPLFDVIVQRKSEQYMGLVPYLEGSANVILSSYQARNIDDESSVKELLKSVATSKGVKVDHQIIQKDNENKAAVNLMFVGFAIMFMMFGLSGAASTILDEKRGGTWSRLMITPATKLQISFGYLSAYFWIGWIQFAMLMVMTKFMFDTEWGNLLYLIPFASLVILCVVGFGLMLAGLVKTKQQAIALSAIVITSTCMLGGVYWSIELVPDFMKKIALATPQRWAMAGFEEIISGSLHTATLIKDVSALCAFTIVFLLIALRLVKYE